MENGVDLRSRLGAERWPWLRTEAVLESSYGIPMQESARVAAGVRNDLQNRQMDASNQLFHDRRVDDRHVSNATRYPGVTVHWVLRRNPIFWS
jgi:hypothetical protein